MVTLLVYHLLLSRLCLKKKVLCVQLTGETRCTILLTGRTKVGQHNYSPFHVTNYDSRKTNNSNESEHTSQSLGDVVHGGLRFVPQQRVRGHHHPRSAEATLGAVSLGYSLLEGHHNHKPNSLSCVCSCSPPLSLQFVCM